MKFENDKNNFFILKEYAEETKKFFDFETKKKYLNANSMISTISKTLEDIKEEIKNILTEKIDYQNKVDKKIKLTNIISINENEKLTENIKIKYENINLESFFKDSNLINNNTNKNFIINLFDKKIESTKILYKDKKEKINEKYFYKNCIDKGNLFFIIKSEEKKIFGGFIPNGLRSSKKNGEYYKEKNNFLFSLDQKKKLKCINEDYSIQHWNNYFPRFGKYPNYDLVLDFDYECISNLGNYYELPLNYKLGSNEANSFFAGSKEFDLEEIEIYQINFEII